MTTPPPPGVKAEHLAASLARRPVVAPAHPPVPEPCVHRGAELTGPERAAAGLTHAKLWLRCLHPDRPRGEVVCPCQGCNPTCPGYAAPGVAAPPPFDGQWQTRPDVLADHHRRAAAFAADIPPYPGGFAGRGVVIAAGGHYWPSAYVTVRVLRHLGCTLPIQVWHRAAETDPWYLSELATFGAECVNADAHPAMAARRRMGGFELKLFAVLNSPFEEVLFLDADCYPVRDPAFLFEEPRYRTVGAVFWPNTPTTDGWTHWRFFGVEPTGIPPVEAGQYVVSKRRAWEPLRLAEWYDDHSDWCYGGAPPKFGDHGDMGSNRVAWAQLRRSPVFYAAGNFWRQPFAYVHVGPDGKAPLFVHRCQSKFSLGGETFPTTTQKGTNLRAGLPGEAVAFGFLDQLRKDRLPFVAEPVTVPPPPKPAVTPRSAKAVVTVATGEVGRELIALTGPFMEAYAARVGADFVVLDWPGHPRWPMSAKYAVAGLFDYYDRVVYADADVLLRPGCPDLFAACPAGMFGAWDELPAHRARTGAWLENDYRRFAAVVGWPAAELPWYFNAGVMVVPKCHRAALEPPPHPVPPVHCGEQHCTNRRVRELGVPFFPLPRVCNWQQFFDPGFRDAPPGAVLHFTGYPTPAARLAAVWERAGLV